MRDEMEEIEKNSSWDLVKLSEKRKPISVRWIYGIKMNSTCEITRYKARLVAKGYSQKRGINYEEVFSPVARSKSIRIIIALAAQFKWNLYHLDVKLAFLNGEIKGEVCVAQPQGFIKEGKEDYVLIFKKALYRLDSTLNSMGLKKVTVIRQCVSQVSKNTNYWWESMWMISSLTDQVLRKLTCLNPQ